MNRYERAQHIIETGGVSLPAARVRTTLVKSASSDMTYLSTYGVDSAGQVLFWRCDCVFGRVHQQRTIDAGGALVTLDGDPCAHVIASIATLDEVGSPV